MTMRLLNSKTANVALFGGAGYVGTAFKKALTKRGIDYFAPPVELLNLHHRDSVSFVLQEIKPSFLINCAGFVGRPNVDACEEQKEETHAGNVSIPFNLAQVCDELNIPWGHVSSGCIYNGYEKDFTEDDEPNFSFDNPSCSYYSGTKAEGEKVLKDQDCYVWRLRIPFDENDDPRNFLTKMQKYTTILNLKNSASHRGDFVDKCLETWEKDVPFGTYNMVHSDPLTAEEVVNKIKKHLSLEHEITFMDNVEKFYEAVGAKTPRSNCVLSNKKLLSTGIEMRTTEEAVEESLENWEVQK